MRRDAEMAVSFFIAGIIQGSIADKGIHNQDYRIKLRTLLKKHFPNGHVYCPFDNHPNSLNYGTKKSKSVFFDLMRRASEATVLIAFLPEASMGTAIEMWEAYHKKKVIISISPLKDNWAVKFLSTAVFDDIPAFERAIESGELRKIIESKSLRATSYEL
ncbi:MAG TPA: hypothetical protein VI387_09470 [Candidatus Brocadiales bacterium]|nr:hypothetical protein [Candidatus Brocadiales bacterium]